MPSDQTRKSPVDLLSSVSATPEVATIGRVDTQPPPETTADSEWDKIAGLEEFRALLKAKLKFIATATAFFTVYYFALPVLVGYAPKLMQTQVFGVINLAYLFALSQFVMAWTVAALYVRAADRFDKMADAILTKLKLK
jgi:uncharacterized membrane protein (DUF485 family)